MGADRITGVSLSPVPRCLPRLGCFLFSWNPQICPVLSLWASQPPSPTRWPLCCLKPPRTVTTFCGNCPAPLTAPAPPHGSSPPSRLRLRHLTGLSWATGASNTQRCRAGPSIRGREALPLQLATTCHLSPLRAYFHPLRIDLYPHVGTDVVLQMRNLRLWEARHLPEVEGRVLSSCFSGLFADVTTQWGWGEGAPESPL